MKKWLYFYFLWSERTHESQRVTGGHRSLVLVASSFTAELPGAAVLPDVNAGAPRWDRSEGWGNRKGAEGNRTFQKQRVAEAQGLEGACRVLTETGRRPETGEGVTGA